MLQSLNLNKSTKIWLNYLIGGLISAVLLVAIYLQMKKQLAKIGPHTLWQTGPSVYLWIAIALMPINLLLEAKKWHMLAGSAQPLSYRSALSSFLAGIAFSIITPNRIGEYPGRLLYLRRKNTFRLVSVSILGAVAQLLTLFIYGSASLIYYNLYYEGLPQFIVLIACLLITVGIYFVYWRFEKWAPFIERIKWLRKYRVYGNLLKRFTRSQQMSILALSIIRYGVYTAQYLILIRWMNIYIPFIEGFFMCALFFWVIAVVPTITLVELGERGLVSIYLFQHFTDNTVGILTATMGVWAINLILPSVIGSLLLIRMRLLR